MPEVEFKSWNLSPGELSSSVAHDGNYYEGGQTGVFQVVMLSLREEKIHQPASASAAPDGKNQENLSQIYLGDLSQKKYNFSQTKSQPNQIWF